MALATTTDVVTRLGRPVADATEEARIQAFIDDATALVLDYCQTDFAVHTDEVFDLVVSEGQAEIPSRYLPGLRVTSVVMDDGSALESSAWKILDRTLYVDYGPGLAVATLTASWGWPTVPATVKKVVCSEVIRWLAVSPGTIREKTGELEVEYGVTANTDSLSEAAKGSLSRYRPRARTLTLRRATTARL